MSSFEVSTEELQGIYGGVGKICPALPQIGLIEKYSTPIQKVVSLNSLSRKFFFIPTSYKAVIVMNKPFVT